MANQTAEGLMQRRLLDDERVKCLQQIESETKHREYKHRVYIPALHRIENSSSSSSAHHPLFIGSKVQNQKHI